MDRGQNFHQANRGGSGGRQFNRPLGQPSSRYNQENGRSSHGRREKQVYVEKHRVNQTSSEGMSGVLPEAKSSNPSNAAREATNGHRENGRSSHRRREKLVYVEKHQVNQTSSEGMSGVLPEAKSLKASNAAREETNGHMVSSGPAPLSNTSRGRVQLWKNPVEATTDNVTLRCDDMDISSKNAEAIRPFDHGVKSFGPLPMNGPRASASDRKPESSEQSVVFDICQQKTSAFKLKPSLLATNRERRSEIQRSAEVNNRVIVLRPGMVLLKSYISTSEQVAIVKKCRDLGIGPGGFYQPGYNDGAKLHLIMMCFGKVWDPQTGNYGDHRPVDGAKPPVIPDEFYQLVKKAIKDSHSSIERENNGGNPTKILPWMTPDICLANFYSTNGRLGLHQDRDESQDSIRKGLPVVSFSIGDSADFLYGDQRDVDKADKLVLESGDVLIFGGQSRNVFHGVTAIHPNTAPKNLLEQTQLRPGRLNLTFRQY